MTSSRLAPSCFACARLTPSGTAPAAATTAPLLSLERAATTVHPPCRTRSGEVESIEVHDLVPRSREVAHELRLGVVTGVDLRDRSELGVRPEDEIDGSCRPFDVAGRAIAALVRVL